MDSLARLVLSRVIVLIYIALALYSKAELRYVHLFTALFLAFWGRYQSDRLLLACREFNLFLLSYQLSGVNGLTSVSSCRECIQIPSIHNFQFHGDTPIPTVQNTRYVVHSLWWVGWLRWEDVSE
ncbi:hypothetical protein VNO80_09639 [Phaseolus coccineus]|uniref:Uncharacterized protein n=1 Tax=Phaseolus coccineus TaxID=3886 RepID=A0AAN9RDW2_PHACN